MIRHYVPDSIPSLEILEKAPEHSLYRIARCRRKKVKMFSGYHESCLDCPNDLFRSCEALKLLPYYSLDEIRAAVEALLALRILGK